MSRPVAYHVLSFTSEARYKAKEADVSYDTVDRDIALALAMQLFELGDQRVEMTTSDDSESAIFFRSKNQQPDSQKNNE